MPAGQLYIILSISWRSLTETIARCRLISLASILLNSSSIVLFCALDAELCSFILRFMSACASLVVAAVSSCTS